MLPECLPLEIFWACLRVRRPQDGPGSYILSKNLWDLPEITGVFLRRGMSKRDGHFKLKYSSDVIFLYIVFTTPPYNNQPITYLPPPGWPTTPAPHIMCTLIIQAFHNCVSSVFYSKAQVSADKTMLRKISFAELSCYNADVLKFIHMR